MGESGALGQRPLCGEAGGLAFPKTVTVGLRSQRRRASLGWFDGRRSRVTLGADGSLCDHQHLTSNSFHSPSDGVYSSVIKTLAVVPSGIVLPARECGGVPCHGPRRRAIDSSRREPSPWGSACEKRFGTLDSGKI